MTCRRGTVPIPINPREARILHLLTERRGEPISRETFLDAIWDDNAWPTTRSVDNYIAALRAKIETDPESPRWIHTVRGVGYRLAPDIGLITASAAFRADDDDESPPEISGLRDQSTRTGWEAPEIDSRDGRKPVLNYLCPPHGYRLETILHEMKNPLPKKSRRNGTAWYAQTF